MTDLTIVKTLFLKAPPEHVWTFLTDPRRLALWFYETSDAVTKPGPLRYLTNSLGKEGEAICWGDIREIDPPRRLVHTFSHDHLQGVETTCVWELADADGGTILTLTHSGFEKAAEAFAMAADHDKGWDEHFIRLRRITL